MFNKCQNLRVRKKNKEIYYYCTKNCKNVEKTCYMGCLDKEYKTPKKLKQKSNKQKALEQSRYSILQDNLNKCFFCNNKSIDWHELLKGRNRKKCIKWGLCIKICRGCHSKTEEDSEFYQKTRIIAQKKWQGYYKKSKEEFIKEFGRSYLKEG